jgi:hypothetical protein
MMPKTSSDTNSQTPIINATPLGLKYVPSIRLPNSNFDMPSVKYDEKWMKLLNYTCGFRRQVIPEYIASTYNAKARFLLLFA